MIGISIFVGEGKFMRICSKLTSGGLEREYYVVQANNVA